MKRHSGKLYAPAAVALLVLSVNAFAAEVKLRERIECRSPVVRLDDVAEISAADGVQLQRLSGMLLMPAPAPGTQRFLRLREVQDMLAAQGEDLSQVRFGGADQIAVASPTTMPAAAPRAAFGGGIDRQAVMLAGQLKQSSSTVDEQAPLDDARAERLRGQLNELIMEYLTANAGHRNAWRVSCNAADRSLELLDMAVATPKCSGGEEPWTGRQRFVISLNTAKGRLQVPVAADVAVTMPAVVAIRPIDKGAVITAAHVQLLMIDYVARGAHHDEPVDSVEKLIGMETRQAIKAGDTVFANQVRAPLLVKRGEEIMVLSRGGRIRVRTLARAIQDGARGELVQVETLDKKDRYDARVTGTREVVVFSPTRMAAAQPAFERANTAWK